MKTEQSCKGHFLQAWHLTSYICITKTLSYLIDWAHKTKHSDMLKQIQQYKNAMVCRTWNDFFSPIQILSLSPAGLRFHLTSIIINSCCFLYANCPLQNPFHSIYWVLGSSLHNRHTNKYLELFGSEGDWYIVKLVFAWPPHRNREHKQFRKNK